jgi:flotillin
VIGIARIVFPTTVFDITLDDYQAYDVGRVPFSVDIKAFFRVSDASLAAERIDNMTDLIAQLEYVVQGAVRAILASVDIEEILGGRSEFGQRFTDEVREQLKKDR